MQTFSPFLFWIPFSISSSHINLKYASIPLFFPYVLFGSVSGLTNGWLMSLFSDGLERLALSHRYTKTHQPMHTNTHTLI